MYVFTEVACNSTYLGTTIMELTEEETAKFLQWQEDVRRRQEERIKHLLLVNRSKTRLEQFHER